MNPILNDFRNVLGRVNDGNVLLTDNGNVEKVNHGNALSRWIWNYKTAENNAEANRAVRQAFYNALSASREGQIVGAEFLNEIRERLGLAGNGNVRDSELSRTGLKSLFDRIDAEVMAKGGRVDQQIKLLKANGESSGAYIELLAARVKALVNGEVCVAGQNETDSVFRSAESMIDVLPEDGFAGFTKSAMARFIKKNVDLIRAFAFDKLYERAFSRFNKLGVGSLGEKVGLSTPDRLSIEKGGHRLLGEVLLTLMKSYAGQKEPTTLIERFCPMKAEANQAVDLAAVRPILENCEKLVNKLFGTNIPQTSMRGIHTLNVKNRLLDQLKQHVLGLRQGEMDVLATLLTAFKNSPNGFGDLALLMSSHLELCGEAREKFLGVLSKKLSARGDAENRFDDLPKVVADAVKETLGDADPKKVLLSLVQKSESPQIPQRSWTDVVEGVYAEITGSENKDNLEALNTACKTMFKTGRINIEEVPDSLFTTISGVYQRSDLDEGARQNAIKDFCTRFEALRQTEGKPPIVGSNLKLVDEDGTKKDLTDEDRAVITFAQMLIYVEGNLIKGLDDITNKTCFFAGAARLNLKAGENISVQTLAEAKKLASRLPVSLIKAFTIYLENEWDKAELYGPVASGNPCPLWSAIKDGQIKPEALTKEDVLTVAQLLNQTKTFTEPTNDSDDWIKISSDITDPNELRDLYRQFREAALSVGVNSVTNSFPDGHPDRMKGGTFAGNGLPMKLCTLRGLGTQDLAATLRTIQTCGLQVSDLRGVNGRIKMSILTHLAQLKGNLDGLAEWACRVTNRRSFAEITLSDVFKLVAKRFNQVEIGDPLETILKPDSTDSAKSAVAFLTGRVKLTEAQLQSQDVLSLLAAAKTLANPWGEARVRVKVLGTEFELVRNDVTGHPSVKIVRQTGAGESLECPFALDLTAFGLRQQIERFVCSNPGKFDDATVLQVLPDIPSSGTVAYTRECCVRVLSIKFGRQPVEFSTLATEDLHALAVGAFSNPVTVTEETINQRLVSPKGYVSAQALERHQRMSVSTTLQNVKLPQKKDEQNPEGFPKLHAFFADLVMNDNIWDFEAAINGDREAARLAAILNAGLAEGSPLKVELEAIKNDPRKIDEVVKTLPENLREEMKPVLQALARLPNPVTVNDDLSELVSAVKNFVTRASEKMQTMVSSLFNRPNVPGQDTKELWKLGFDDLGGDGGLDLTSPKGRFMKAVLDSYVTDADIVEKRAMLSAMIRHTTGGDTSGKIVGELLKGAGPLLQKMLQGLPPQSFGPETRRALKDMKSRLMPIPDSVVREQMAELIQLSNGEINRIEVIKSLGQATIGQVFLCRIYTREHQETGEEVVIKLLRPNIENAIRREHDKFLEVINRLPENERQSQLKAFESDYRNILKELDFTLESENVDLGAKAYEKPNVAVDSSDNIKTFENVFSTKRHPSVPSTVSALVLTKAPGETFDSFVDNRHRELNGLLKDCREEVELPGEGKREFFKANDPRDVWQKRRQLDKMREVVARRREQLVDFVKVWMNEALFRSGFFHGDLHSGNLMTDGKKLTVIDYGNAYRLTDTQKGVLASLFACAATKREGDFCTALKKGLPPEQAAKLTDAVREQVGQMLCKGSQNDVCARVSSALAVIQKAGVVIPESVQAFVNSMVRLHAAMDDLDALSNEIEQIGASLTAMDESVEVFNPDKEQKDAFQNDLYEIFPFFKALDHEITVFGKPGMNPKTESDEFSTLRSNVPQMGDLERVLREEGSAAHNKAVTAGWTAHFFDKMKGKTPDEIVAFLEKIISRYDRNGVENSYYRSAFNHHKDNYLRACQNEPQLDSPGRKDWAKALEGAKTELVGHIVFHAEQIAEGYRSTPQFGAMTEKTSFEEGIMDVLSANIDVKFSNTFLGDVPTSFEGLLPTMLERTVNKVGLAGIGLSLWKDKDSLRKHLKRVQIATRRAFETNLKLDPHAQVNGLVKPKLDRLAAQFRLPISKVLFSGYNPYFPKTAAEILTVIQVNLQAARKALGNRQELLKSEIAYLIRLADAYLDGALSKGIAGLGNDQRTELNRLVAASNDVDVKNFHVFLTETLPTEATEVENAVAAEPNESE